MTKKVQSLSGHVINNDVPTDISGLAALQTARDEVESLKTILGAPDTLGQYLLELRDYRKALVSIRNNPDQALLIASSILEAYHR